jgi:hypothetical protein
MCSAHPPESSQCFDCGRYITQVSTPSHRQLLLRYLSSSAREALFSDVAHSGSPSPSTALATAPNHVTTIVDHGRVVDGRTQVKLPASLPSLPLPPFSFTTPSAAHAAQPQQPSNTNPNPKSLPSAYTAAPVQLTASAVCVVSGPA